jgi:hypothetical protein
VHLRQPPSPEPGQVTGEVRVVLTRGIKQDVQAGEPGGGRPGIRPGAFLGEPDGVAAALAAGGAGDECDFSCYPSGDLRYLSFLASGFRATAAALLPGGAAPRYSRPQRRRPVLSSCYSIRWQNYLTSQPWRDRG